MKFQYLAFLSCAQLALALPAGVKLANPSAKDIVPNEYIVVLKNTLKPNEIEAHKSQINAIHSMSINSQNLSGIQYNYTLSNLKGYSGHFDDATLKAISQAKEVSYIEAVTKFKISAVQYNPPWGLARLSNRQPGGNTYTYNERYAGTGITAYVIDTGVYVGHQEFQGRATIGANFAGDGNPNDLNGHGTHCAGTIGGATYGVAKNVRIVAVKVLDGSGSGSTSGILAGMNWVARSATPYRSVASMSLGGGYSQSLNDGVRALHNAGIAVAVAAGNDNRDARNTSPASEPSILTVGATDQYDNRASFSNYGPVVDVFAPGKDVLSAWIGRQGATNTISGTSMATPHVAGLLAYFMSASGGMSPSDAYNRVITLGLKGILKGLGAGSPNVLAWNGGGN